MAVIKLTIQPDKASLDATINEINQSLNQVKGLNIKIESQALDATQKKLLAVSREQAKVLAAQAKAEAEAWKAEQQEIKRAAAAEARAAKAEANAKRQADAEKRAQEQKTQALIQAARKAEDLADREEKRKEQELIRMKKLILKEQQQYEASQEKEAEAAEKAAQREAAAKERAVQASVSLEKQYSNLIRQIENLKAKYPEGTFDAIEQQAREAREELRNLDQTTETYVQDVERLKQGYGGLTRDLANVRSETQQLETTTTSLSSSIGSMVLQYISLRMIINKVVSEFREALQTMKDVDSALVTVQKTTGYTKEQIDRLTDSSYKLASAYGRTASEILDAASVYARAGFKDNLEEMTELSALLQNVGDLEGEAAAKFLVATNAAWQLDGSYEALLRVIDGLNAQTNQAAVDMAALTSGITVAGSVFSNAGESVQTFTGLLGAGVAVTQRSGSEIARGLRTIAMNVRQIKGELEDGEIIDAESISDAAAALSSVGISVADSRGELRLTSDVLSELAGKWGSLTTAEQSYLAQSLAGKRQANVLTALMQNWSEVERQMTLYAEGAGSAMKENEIYLNSWEAKTKQLDAAWTEFVADLVSTDSIKLALDTIIGIIQFLNTETGKLTITAAAIPVAALGIVGAISKIITSIEAMNLALLSNPWTMVATIAVAAILGIVAAYSKLNQTAEDHANKAKAAMDEYKRLNSQIEENNQKIQENKELIEAANEAGSSDVYIKRLQNENGLLEAQNALLEAQAKAERRAANQEAQKAFEAKSYRIQTGTETYTVLDDLMGPQEVTTPAYSNVSISEYAEHLMDLAKQGENVDAELAEVFETLSQINGNLDEGDALSNKYSLAIGRLANEYNLFTTGLEMSAGAAERTGNSLDEIIGAEYQRGIDEIINKAEKAAKAFEEELIAESKASAAYKEAIKGVTEAVSEYGGHSWEAYQAMQALEKAVPGSTAALYDFDTATLKVDASLVTDAETLGYVIEKIEELRNRMFTVSQQASKFDEAIGGVVTALADFGAGSVEVYDAMKKLEETIPGGTDKLYDFDTATLITQEDIFGSKDALLDFIDTTKQLEFSEAISELEKLAASYWDVAGAALAAMNAEAAQQMGGVLAFTGTDASAAQAGIGSQLAGVKAQKAEWDAYIAALRARKDYVPSASTGGGGSGSSGGGSAATGKTADAELERLKAIVSLEKAELSYLQASGKSLDDINAKRREIQAALHMQAEYMRGILATMDDTNSTEAERKAYEEAILALSTEWWNIQKNIDDDLAKAEEERLKQLEEEAKLLEEQKKLQQEMFDNLKSIVDDYYAKLISDKEEELSLEEKILAVQKAEAALANAQRERNVRYYNASTGQWEWQANAKNVKSAQDALKKAQDDLNKYQRDQAWKEFKAAWAYVSEQIKSGAMTFREAYDYMYDAMKAIQDKYGVDLGVTLEDSIGGFKTLNYGIDGLTREVADRLGASVGVLNEKLKQYETAVGALKDAFDEVSDKVKNGELSMEDAYQYLRDRARQIADKYGIDMTGALEEAIAGMDKTNMSIEDLWKSVIITLMKVNSARWFDASDDEKQLLHAQNEYLGSLIGATYDPSGYWYLNGSQLYGSQKGASYDSEGYGSRTGSGGGVGGSDIPKTGVEGVTTDGRVYYDSYGNEYPTLEAAAAGNAANSTASGEPYGWWNLWQAGPLVTGQAASHDSPSYADRGETGYFKSSDGNIYNYETAPDDVLASHGLMRYEDGAVLLAPTARPYGIETPMSRSGSLRETMAKHGDSPEERAAMQRKYDQLTGVLSAEQASAIMSADNDMTRMGMDGALSPGTSGVGSQVVYGSIGSQHNGNVYNFGSISLGEAQARSMTVFDLVTMAGGLGSYSGV